MSKYLNFNCMGEVVKIPHDSAIIEKSSFLTAFYERWDNGSNENIFQIDATNFKKLVIAYQCFKEYELNPSPLGKILYDKHMDLIKNDPFLLYTIKTLQINDFEILIPWSCKSKIVEDLNLKKALHFNDFIIYAAFLLKEHKYFNLEIALTYGLYNQDDVVAWNGASKLKVLQIDITWKDGVEHSIYLAKQNIINVTTVDLRGSYGSVEYCIRENCKPIIEKQIYDIINKLPDKNIQKKFYKEILSLMPGWLDVKERFFYKNILG